jgi:hypothetical protein
MVTSERRTYRPAGTCTATQPLAASGERAAASMALRKAAAQSVGVGGQEGGGSGGGRSVCVKGGDGARCAGAQQKANMQARAFTRLAICHSPIANHAEAGGAVGDWLIVGCGQVRGGTAKRSAGLKVWVRWRGGGEQQARQAELLSKVHLQSRRSSSQSACRADQTFRRRRPKGGT